MTGATATESTRDQIIHAAAESLLENGYSGTSVRSIASKAGVAIGNLQYWFPTKSELLVEAWRHLTARSVEELRATFGVTARFFLGPRVFVVYLMELIVRVISRLLSILERLFCGLK